MACEFAGEYGWVCQMMVQQSSWPTLILMREPSDNTPFASMAGEVVEHWYCCGGRNVCHTFVSNDDPTIFMANSDLDERTL